MPSQQRASHKQTDAHAELRTRYTSTADTKATQGEDTNTHSLPPAHLHRVAQRVGSGDAAGEVGRVALEHEGEKASLNTVRVDDVVGEVVHH
eukprot:3936886-Rhodomonas_salina.2